MNITPCKQGLISVIEEIDHTLRFLSQSGWQGFDCSARTLDRLDTWKITKPHPSPSVFRPKTTGTDSLESIRQDAILCRKCRLFEKRKNIVTGSGSLHARIMFIGEAPGYEEDEQGEPFVGPAGQLLTKIIQAIKLTREQVYICNVLKCHPPDNRNPLPDEIKACLPFLERQIEVIKPEFICSLGKYASQTLLNCQTSITELRGNFFDYKGIRLMPTFHPAYLLRNPERKREVWEDMKKLMKEYG